MLLFEQGKDACRLAKQYREQGVDKYAFWQVNGSPIFGMMPPGIIAGVDVAEPIYLQRGNALWGATHIEKRHQAWLTKNNHSVASMVYLKLRQQGDVYSAEEPEKSKILMRVNPSALLLLRHSLDGYFSVTSMYFKNEALDGLFLGKYFDLMSGSSNTLVFTPPPEPVAPSVSYVKRRRIPDSS